MRTDMKKSVSLLVVITMLIGILSVTVSAFSLDPKFHLDSGKSCGSLEEAFEGAEESGSVITQDSNMPICETDGSITVTKDVTLRTGKTFFGEACVLQYNGTEEPLFVIENGGKLTLQDAVISGGTMAETLTGGGLILVKDGGTLVLDGSKDAPVVLENSVLTAEDGKGGAIYVEQGGTVIVKRVMFSGNSAAQENDLYSDGGTVVRGSLDNFKKVNTAAAFSDVPAGEWFEKNVTSVYEYGLMIGTGDGAFSPKNPIHLNELIVLACRIHDCYYGMNTAFDITDDWFAPYLAYAIENGVIEDGFYPDYTAEATRADFVYVMAAAIPEEAREAVKDVELSSIPDVDGTEFYADAVLSFYRSGILAGTDAGIFNPDGTITRADSAAIVSRIVETELRIG